MFLLCLFPLGRYGTAHLTLSYCGIKTINLFCKALREILMEITKIVKKSTEPNHVDITSKPPVVLWAIEFIVEIRV